MCSSLTSHFKLLQKILSSALDLSCPLLLTCSAVPPLRGQHSGSHCFEGDLSYFTQHVVHLGQGTRRFGPEVFLSLHQDTLWAEMGIQLWPREPAFLLMVREAPD